MGIDCCPHEVKLFIGKLFRAKKLVPFIDLAYPAFASGDFDKDTEIVRKFAAMGFQMFVAQSFAKILGLYSERLGAIHLIASTKEVADKALSQMKYIYQHSLILKTHYESHVLKSPRSWSSDLCENLQQPCPSRDMECRIERTRCKNDQDEIVRSFIINNSFQKHAQRRTSQIGYPWKLGPHC
jgi:hypothetical protein